MKEKFDILKDASDKNEYSYKLKTYSTLFDVSKTKLKDALQKLYEQIKNDIQKEGVNLISLDDREITQDNVPMPIALVVGYVNTHLIKDNIRNKVSLISVSGEVYTSHACGVLLAFGVDAIYPYMLYASICNNLLDKEDGKYEIQEKLKKAFQALNDGILRIMSKMGIATVASYKNSSLHDIIGLSKEIIDDCFPNSLSTLHGLDYGDIEQRIQKLQHSNDNYYPDSLEFGGLVKYVYGQEFHDYTPAVMKLLNDQSKKSIQEFKPLKAMIEGRDKKFIRDFLQFKSSSFMRLIIFFSLRYLYLFFLF